MHKIDIICMIIKDPCLKKLSQNIIKTINKLERMAQERNKSAKNQIENKG